MIMETPRPKPPKMRVVQAAGAVVWRLREDAEPFPGTTIPRSSQDIEVLLVHRPRYGDWSWPKGKRERGESLVATAVREVEEETGVAVCLGAPLTTQRYRLGMGATKEVYYWVGTTQLGAAPYRLRTQVQPAPSSEIDYCAWLNVEQAGALLTRRGDKRLLEELLQRLKERTLLTRAIVFTCGNSGAGMGTAAANPLAVDPLAFTPEEIGTDEIDANEIGADEVSRAEIGAVALDIAELSTDELSAAEVSADEITTDELSTDELSAKELGSDEFVLVEQELSEQDLLEQELAGSDLAEGAESTEVEKFARQEPRQRPSETKTNNPQKPAFTPASVFGKRKLAGNPALSSGANSAFAAAVTGETKAEKLSVNLGSFAALQNFAKHNQVADKSAVLASNHEEAAGTESFTNAGNGANPDSLPWASPAEASSCREAKNKTEPAAASADTQETSRDSRAVADLPIVQSGRGAASALPQPRTATAANLVKNPVKPRITPAILAKGKLAPAATLRQKNQSQEKQSQENPSPKTLLQKPSQEVAPSQKVTQSEETVSQQGMRPEAMPQEGVRQEKVRQEPAAKELGLKGALPQKTLQKSRPEESPSSDHSQRNQVDLAIRLMPVLSAYGVEAVSAPLATDSTNMSREQASPLNAYAFLSGAKLIKTPVTETGSELKQQSKTGQNLPTNLSQPVLSIEPDLAQAHYFSSQNFPALLEELCEQLPLTSAKRVQEKITNTSRNTLVAHVTVPLPGENPPQTQLIDLEILP